MQVEPPWVVGRSKRLTTVEVAACCRLVTSPVRKPIEHGAESTLTVIDLTSRSSVGVSVRATSRGTRQGAVRPRSDVPSRPNGWSGQLTSRDAQEIIASRESRGRVPQYAWASRLSVMAADRRSRGSPAVGGDGPYLRRLVLQAGVRRRFAPQQLRSRSGDGPRRDSAADHPAARRGCPPRHQIDLPARNLLRGNHLHGPRSARADDAR